MKKIWLCQLLAAWLVVGCQTPPTKAFLRLGPSYTNQIPEVARLGLVTDAIINYDCVGTNYFVLADSEFAATNMLLDAKQFLEKKGYEISFSTAPLIGAFENPVLPMNVADKRKDKPSVRYPPFYISDTLTNDEPYRQALIKVISQTMEAVEQKGRLPTDTFLSDPAVTNCLHLIAQRNKTDYIMIISGNGVIVSAGKQSGQIIGTSLLTTLMTAGFVTATRYNVSSLDSCIGLIDLRTGEILWANSLRLNDVDPASADTYQGRWSSMLLYYLPDRTESNEKNSDKDSKDTSKQ